MKTKDAVKPLNTTEECDLVSKPKFTPLFSLPFFLKLKANFL